MVFDPVKYSNEYIKENYGRFNLFMDKELLKQVKQAAKDHGISTAEYIRQAITEKISKDEGGKI